MESNGIVRIARLVSQLIAQDNCARSSLELATKGAEGSTRHDRNHSGVLFYDRECTQMNADSRQWNRGLKDGPFERHEEARKDDMVLVAVRQIAVSLA